MARLGRGFNEAATLGEVALGASVGDVTGLGDATGLAVAGAAETGGEEAGARLGADAPPQAETSTAMAKPIPARDFVP